LTPQHSKSDIEAATLVDSISPPNANCEENANTIPKNCEENTNIIPKLEEFLPELLLVNDPKILTFCTEGSDTTMDSFPIDTSKIYKRVFPKSGVSKEIDTLCVTDPTSSCVSIALDSDICTARLDFTSATPIRLGSHSRVYRSSLRLPEALISTEVTVAAKLAFQDRESCTMLNNKAKIYDFPLHVMEDWSGSNFLPSYLNHHLDKLVVPCKAVVLNFYGYYVPVGPTQDEGGPKPSAILLVEECSTPIELSMLSETMKSVCLPSPSFFL
jgi:hypothetical protein